MDPLEVERGVTKVLVIDDDAGMRDFLGIVLRKKGLSVELASEGEQALAALRARRFAAIVCDVNLPGRSGLELLAELRAASGGVPVILISGAAPFDAALGGVLDGAAAYVTKPLDVEDLYWILIRAIGSVPCSPRPPRGTEPGEGSAES